MEEDLMKIKSFIKILMAFTFFSLPALGSPQSLKYNEAWFTNCVGWASEISEIAGALIEEIEESKIDTTEALYDLEYSAQERCSLRFGSEILLAESLEKEIALAAADIENSLNTDRSTSAERVLTSALLKLVRSQITVVSKASQG